MPSTNIRDRNASGSSRESPNPTATGRPNLRGDTRKNGGSMLLEDQQDINDATEGRKFLECHSLLCPLGEPPTHTSLSTCLHQISAMAGIQRPALNAIRAVAFMLEEMEDTQINETVKEALDSQITEFTSDMKLLIEDAREKIDMQLKASEEKLSQFMQNTATQPRQATQATYASTLVSPPPHANPRVAAREGIRARQFLLEGTDGTKYSHYNNLQLKAELNKILTEIGQIKGKIRAATKVRNRGILIELDSDEATLWFQKEDNRAKFCRKIGPKVESRTRTLNLIIFNVPLTFDPEIKEHQIELVETNNIDPKTISSSRWVKPIARRMLEQRTAHLFITFNNADAENRVITNGIHICNRRCLVEKVKKEPIRCLKCQGWNHFAKDCLEKDDTCGNCAGSHMTKDCPTPTVKRCVSCRSNEHASWSRECPTFVKKAHELNERIPENALQYIPTADPWTWTVETKQQPPYQQAPMARINYTQDRSQLQKARRTQFNDKIYDTYIPDYSNQKPPTRSTSTKILDLNAQNSIKDLLDFQLLDQPLLENVNAEASNSIPAPPIFT